MLKHLQPLPISEEMLGAYLEGNLSYEEADYVESVLQQDDNMRGLVEEVGDLPEDWTDCSADAPFMKFGQGIIDLRLPEVDTFSDLDFPDLFSEMNVENLNPIENLNLDYKDSLFDNELDNDLNL